MTLSQTVRVEYNAILFTLSFALSPQCVVVFVRISAMILYIMYMCTRCTLLDPDAAVDERCY